MSLDSIVNVSITRDTRVPSQQGFGVPAFISKEAEGLITELVKTYDASTALEALIADGFTTGSETYKAVSKIVSQSPRISQLKVIKEQASIAQISRINIETVLSDTLYQFTYNGVQHEYTSDADATETEIQTGILALVTALDGVTGAVDGLSAVTLTAVFAGKAFSLAVGTNLSVTTPTPNLGPIEELIAARDFDDDWYFLLDTTTNAERAELIADYIETQIKLYFYQTDDADSKDTQEDGLLARLKAKKLDRTFGIWTFTDKISEYKPAAITGVQAPKEAGASTWNFKQASGITPDKFTAQELSNIKSKNGNVYVAIAGFNIFQEGNVASGEWIDIMRGTDELTARIKESVFGLFVSVPKVPYTDEGIESVGLRVRDVLDVYVRRDFLVGGPVDGPQVTVPLRSETSTTDRANRELKNVNFSANYAGAVHKTTIVGNIAV